MLIMFGVGAGNLSWILILGALMGTEENMPWSKKAKRSLSDSAGHQRSADHNI